MQQNQLRIGVLTALWQREKLSAFFLDHWNKVFASIQNVQFKPLAVGSEADSSKNLAESNCWNYIEAPNKPLGNKWNIGMKWFEVMDVDFVMCLGSDDFMCEKTVNELVKHMTNKHDIIGFTDCYLYQKSTDKLVYWSGYRASRRGKIIGAGRCMSSKLLKKINFEPWDSRLNCRLDGSMDLKLSKIQHTIKPLCLQTFDGFLVDIKSDVNITPFTDTQNNINSSLIKSKLNDSHGYL
jgi:hypothetical protein